MIESVAIKKFIIDYFVENGQEDTVQKATNIGRYISANFVLNEIVFVKSLGITGRITKISMNGYKVLLNSPTGNYEKEFNFEDLTRKEEVSVNCIADFIKFITIETPFGRVLRENAYGIIISNQNMVPRDKNLIEKKQAEAKTLLSNKKIKKTKAEEKLENRGKKIKKIDLKPKKDEKVKKKDQPKEKLKEKLKEKKKDLKLEKKAKEKEKTKEKAKENKNLLLPNQLSEKEYKLNLKPEFKVSIDGYSDKSLETLIKIYSFVTSFEKVFDVENITLEELGKCISDSVFESTLAFKIISKLVSVIHEEIRSLGIESFLTNIKPASMIVEEFVKKENKDSEKKFQLKNKFDFKKKIEINERNWKTNTKSFIHFLVERSDKYFSIYVDCINKRKYALSKEHIDTRLSFLNFLVNVFFSTKAFREYVQEEVDSLKALDKNKADLITKIKKLKMEIKASGMDKKSPDVIKARIAGENDLNEITAKIALSPIKIEIGCILDVLFININQKIYSMKNGKFYILPVSVIGELYNCYVPKNKVEKDALNSLWYITELFSKQKN